MQDDESTNRERAVIGAISSPQHARVHDHQPLLDAGAGYVLHRYSITVWLHSPFIASLRYRF